MSATDTTTEERILRAVKLTLTSIIKDTATQPGMVHPLKPETIDMLRDCLLLISEREQALALAAGRSMGQRPRYVDEPRAEVVVPLHSIGRRRKPGSDEPLN